MSLKIVRNDITKMQCDAIVNTAAASPVDTFDEVGAGCDRAIYKAAGAEKLIAARREIGVLAEGEAAITPGFDLPAKYIIHAVSPVYVDGSRGEEDRLRNCYRNSLRIAVEQHLSSIAFPLIATGSFGYPQEEGMRIAVDEINSFLLENDMQIFLVVFGSKATGLGQRIYPDLEAYIDQNYVREKREEEYGGTLFAEFRPDGSGVASFSKSGSRPGRRFRLAGKAAASAMASYEAVPMTSADHMDRIDRIEVTDAAEPVEFSESHESKLEERMRHMSDTFSEYLMYLIEEKGKNPVDVYKKAIVDKKVFSKIRNHPEHHPNKMTAMCLCVGAELNLDEARDLLARAGYALSPCDKTDVIFSYFIENRIYDMIELDIQLEEHGLKCLIQ